MMMVWFPSDSYLSIPLGMIFDSLVGSIELFGRKDRQVKLNGFRIELDEVEHKVSLQI
jgi:hypothetical protein